MVKYEPATGCRSGNEGVCKTPMRGFDSRSGLPVKKSVLLATLFAFLIFTPAALGQEFDFAKAYQDYIYAQTVYDQAYSDYDKAKNNYLKNSTLTLKEEARKKTYTMLTFRDELFRVYLTSVRMKLIETKVAVDMRLDDEIAWYQSHKAAYKSDDPLADLLNKSKESESRFKSHTSPIAYESLFNLSFGEIGNIRTSYEGIYKSLKNSIDLGVSGGVLKLDPFNRWFTDIENALKELDTINGKSKTRIAKMYDSSTMEPKNAFSGAVNELALAITKLTELNGFLTELLNSINAQLTKT